MKEGTVTPLAGYAAAMLSRDAGADAPLVSACVTRLFEVLSEGGVCLPLSLFGDASDIEKRLLSLPVAGMSGQKRPLIVDSGLVYLQRYHALETALAQGLLALARTPAEVPAGAETGMARIFSQRLSVITGGPGTGKTFTAGRLLRLLAAEARGGVLSVVLTAPTGRASARLFESVSLALEGVPGVTLAHGTVHRILGSGPDPTVFRRNAAHPIPADVVVLDEASMMDLPLMARLVDAVDPAATRLIVLGDPDQLPSIHSGSILADVVAAAETSPHSPLSKCLLHLTRNHRSGGEPELAALIDAARCGNADVALDLLTGGSALSMERPPLPSSIGDFVREELHSFMEQLGSSESPAAALKAATAHRLVCMLRQGPCGADAVNELAVSVAADRAHAGASARYFHGLPVIVTRNDPLQELCNGDTGVILRRSGRLSAIFDGPDGPRAVPLSALPPVEPAYALTVHRAQGSEYGAVTLLLPPEDHPLLTRELFYTGVSRARQSLKVMATPELVRRALARKSQRASGLAPRLAWGSVK